MPHISQPINITPKQFQVLEQIGNFQRSQCYSATIGELAKALNISRATAYEHIAALREKKLLAASTGKARWSWRLCAPRVPELPDCSE